MPSRLMRERAARIVFLEDPLEDPVRGAEWVALAQRARPGQPKELHGAVRALTKEQQTWLTDAPDFAKAWDALDSARRAPCIEQASLALSEHPEHGDGTAASSTAAFAANARAALPSAVPRVPFPAVAQPPVALPSSSAAPGAHDPTVAQPLASSGGSASSSAGAFAVPVGRPPLAAA
eukprot:2902786-Pyramimonas_sp.AAC.1